MTAVICSTCGYGDDLGDGGMEVGFDWETSTCADCQTKEAIVFFLEAVSGDSALSDDLREVAYGLLVRLAESTLS